jgi:hypothetical protein
MNVNTRSTNNLFHQLGGLSLGLAAALILVGLPSGHAANFTLKQDDAIGTTSWNAALNWTNKLTGRRQPAGLQLATLTAPVDMS